MRAVFAALVLAGLAVPAAAQEADKDAQSQARYIMRATAEGTLRLDTRTGVTTLCTTEGNQLRCAVSAEERAAYEAEIDALGVRLERLEQRLIALETPEGGSVPPTSEAQADVEEDSGPSSSAVTRAARGFARTVKKWRKDFDGS